MPSTVLEQALRLPTDERARVAREIIASLDGDADQDADARWLEEIERRCVEIDNGTAELRSWEEVRAGIVARLRSR